MTIWNVSNTSELQAALSSAAGGDEIVLASGSYGDVNLSGRTYTSELTIKSAAPGTVTVGNLNIPSNVTIDGVEIQGQISLAGGAHHVTIQNCTLGGVVFANVSDITFNNNVAVLAFFDNVSGFEVKNNYFHDTTSDFMQIKGDSHNGLVENNTFYDNLAVKPTHPDAIQMFETPSGIPHDIVIRGNYIYDDPSTGDEWMQGIFLGGPSSSGYKNILIEQNLVAVGSPNSIFVSNGAENVVVRDNSLLSWSPGGGGATIRLAGNAAGVTVDGNVMLALVNEGSGASIGDNLVYSNDPSSPLYWGNLFEGTGDSWQGFVPKSGSPIDFSSNYGAQGRLVELLNGEDGSPGNARPDAVDDAVTTGEDTAVTVDVTGNDSDPDGDAFEVTSVGSASHGTTALNPDGTITYLPDANYVGADSFSYTIRDDNGGTDTATVTVNVTPANDDPPVAVDDSFYAASDVATTINVFANDSDPDGEALTIDSFTQPSHGTIVYLGNGEFVYTANPGHSGADSFTYTLKDSTGLTDTATVDLNVLDLGDIPAPVLGEGAHDFAGNTSDAVILPHSAAYELASGTLEIVFTADALTTRQGIFSKDSSYFDDGGHFTILLEGDDILVRLQSTTATYEVRLANAVTVGTEYHLAVVFGDGGMEVHLDGTLAGTNAYTGGLLGNAEPIVIGANQWASGDQVADILQDAFNGNIAKVNLYDRGLSVTEIQFLSGLTDDPPSDAPAAPVISSYSGDSGVVGDGVTSDDTLTLSGTAEADCTVTVYDGAVLLGTVLADGNGDWSYTTASLAEGAHSFKATATDAADNTGDASAALNVVIDTAAPGVPSIVSFSGDSGVAGDGITGDDTLTLSGTAEADSTVTVYDGAVLLGTVLADGNGDWSYTTASLAEGAHSFEATATDAAGNTSATSAALNVTVDTAAPGAPSIVSFSGDSGVAGDGITSDDTLTLSGTAEADSTVTIYDGAVLLGTVLADGNGDWSYTTASLAEGAHSFEAMATDAAGNSGVASAALDVTIDTAAPNAPIITDSTVDGSAITLAGTAEPNSIVSIYKDGIWFDDTGADASGVWDYTIGPLADGNYSFAAKATDAADNTSEASTALNVTVDVNGDSEAPLAPVIVSFSNDSGVVGDGITSDDTLTVSGTAEADSTVTVYDGAALLGAVLADGNGDWSLTTASMAEGAHSFTATATDAAGNTGVPSAALDVIIDTTPPVEPTDADDTANAVAENAVNGNAVGLTAFAGSAVTYSLDDDAGGRFAIDPSSGEVTVADGSLLDYESSTSHTITVRATDQAGNFSTSSFDIAVTDIDEAPPGGEPIAFEATSFSSYWNQDNNRSLTITDDGTTLELSGNTWVKYDYPYAVSEGTILVFEFRADSEAEIHGIGIETDNDLNTGPDQFALFGTQDPPYLDGFVTDFKTYDSTGEWVQYQIHLGDYFEGDIQYLTFVHDNDSGPQNEVSYFRNVQLIEESETPDTAAPGAPLITSFSSDSGVAGDGITSDDTLTLNGTAEADSTVTVYDGAVLLGTVLADGNGDWSLTTVSLGEGAHSFTATATDAASNTSLASVAMDVTIDTTPPSEPIDADDAVNAVAENTVNGSTVGLAAFADDAGGGAVTYSLDDNAGGRFAIDADSGVVRVADGSLLDYETAVSHEITVRATDQAGNSSIGTYEIGITDIDEDPPGSEAITFAQTNFSSYANQDRNRDLTITGDGTTLELSGNTWVKYDYPYVVTKDTLLVFEFRADSEAEIHGIGVETDNDLRTAPDQFVLFGSQNVSRLAGFATDFNTYDSTGEWVQYQISLGDYIEGNIQYLTFIHDDDAGTQTEVSYFRNVQFVEADQLVQTLASTASSKELASGQTLIGTSKDETLKGGAGNDTLAGRKGNDKLVGKAGSDIFLFDTKLDAEKNVDRIKDFSVNEDTIQLDKDSFAHVGKAGQLAAKRFEVGKKADDKSDRIIYREDKGKLLYDKDGKGGAKAVEFARIDKHLDLSSDDILIVS